MPRTGDPISFGTAYVKALLTFDTTKQSLAERRAWLMAWTPPDGFYSDAGDMLDDFLPSKEVWAAAKAAHQSQTVIVQRAWIPESQKELTASTPVSELKATRYPTIVTASVLRQVRGDPGSNQDLPLTISVAVSCPPDEPCVAYAPGRQAVVN